MVVLRSSVPILLLCAASIVLTGSALAEAAVETGCGDSVAVSDDATVAPSPDDVTVSVGAFGCPGPICPPVVCAPCLNGKFWVKLPFLTI